ncbi:helix-turn-helix domain-containing protein [Carnobacterium divergens]|uniref:helix-turn-helix domain-containing protein n=1 Tax=Carnobacterium divergens TaxID=2748 RepID=UPI0007F45DDB|nr:helix-turn-helix domain-containing protein [Carnobacterium divergens]SBO17125.1 transposase [Carnobacterium divergens]
MSKHNFYPVELKIQIIERFLNGESAASLREEFKIPSRGTLYRWKDWYLNGEITSLESSSGRRLEKNISVSEQLDKVTKELNLLKNIFLKKEDDS